MAITEASRRAHAKYMRKAYARLNVQYPAEYVERIKAAAAARGESIAGFVKAAIDARIAADQGKDVKT